MLQNLKIASYYSFRYLLFIILFYIIGKLFGAGNLYGTSIIIIVILNYLSLLWGVIRPLSKADIDRKKFMFEFIAISSLLLSIFLVYLSVDYINIVMALVINIFEYLMLVFKKN